MVYWLVDGYSEYTKGNIYYVTLAAQGFWQLQWFSIESSTKMGKFLLGTYYIHYKWLNLVVYYCFWISRFLLHKYYWEWRLRVILYIQPCIYNFIYTTLSNFTKLFESILFTQLNRYMQNKFSKYLTGFRKNHNTQNSLLRMIESWKVRLNNGSKV